MKIKAILMDMDGTLLGKSQVAVSPRNMRAVQSAIEHGIQVIPCTGRVYNMLPPQILTQKGLRYFVTSHGARVYDSLTEESIYTDLIPAEHASEIMRILEGKGLYNEIAANATIFFEKAMMDEIDISLVPEHHLWYFRDQCYTVLEKPSEYFLKNGIGVEKMNLYGIPEYLQQSIYDELNATGYVKWMCDGVGSDLECLNNGLDKVFGSDALLKRLGISYEETMAIGDSSSDLGIIKACGLGVAMGNAPEHVRAQADAVTARNEEDGFALALEKYVL